MNVGAKRGKQMDASKLASIPKIKEIMQINDGLDFGNFHNPVRESDVVKP